MQSAECGVNERRRSMPAPFIPHSEFRTPHWSEVGFFEK